MKELESPNGTEPDNISAVMIHGRAIAEGQGTSSRYAKSRACADAVTKIESMPLFRFRKEYGCDCRPEESESGDNATE